MKLIMLLCFKYIKKLKYILIIENIYIYRYRYIIDIQVSIINEKEYTIT